MDKIYCENKKIELRKRRDILLPLIETIKERYQNKKLAQYQKIYEVACAYDFRMLALLLELQKSFSKRHKNCKEEIITISGDELQKIYELDSIERSLEMIDDWYLDTPWVRFDGDVIITDPCYLVSYSDKEYDEKRQFLQDNLILLKDTLYGDWSCVTINTDTKEKIGTFCADGAEVCVISLAEVKKLTPNYTPEDESTLLKDFHGEIRIVIEEDFYEEQSCKNYSVHVEGRGNINFKTYQCGF